MAAARLFPPLLGVHPAPRSLHPAWHLCRHPLRRPAVAALIEVMAAALRVLRKTQARPPVGSVGGWFARLGRWRRLDSGIDELVVVHYDGKVEVAKMRRSSQEAATRASGVGAGVDATRSPTRARATEEMMQAGVDMWEAARALGMSPEMVSRIYGHHHPVFGGGRRAI